MWKKTAACVCGLILLLLLMPMALSESITDLWVSSDGGKGSDAIAWYREENKKYSYYLFLPGNVELSALKIGFTGAETITVQGEKVKNGDSAAFLKPGEQYTVTAGKKYTLHVMQGSPD